jgi:hypothetical protein
MLDQLHRAQSIQRFTYEVDTIIFRVNYEMNGGELSIQIRGYTSGWLGLSYCLRCWALWCNWWIMFLYPFINRYVIIYFNDILICNWSKIDHLKHLKKVLKVLLDNKLYVYLKRYRFMIEKVLILMFIVSATSIHVDDDKVKTIRDWPKSKTVSEVCSFYESTIFYRWFIQIFSIIVSPITECIKKKKFDYGDKAEKNFALIKKSLSIASILTLSNFIMLFEVESDACM